MAIVAVQQPRQQSNALDRIAKGLGIAQSVFGIKSALEQSEVRDLQQRKLEQEIQSEERKTGLETAGIVPSGEFNAEFRAIDPTKVADLETRSGLSIEPVRVKVEDPTSETGFVEKLALQKDDLSEIRKLIKQGDIAKLKISTKQSLEQGKDNATKLAEAAGQTSIIPRKVDDAFSKEFAKYVSSGDEAKNFDTILKLEETLTDADKKLSSGFGEQLIGLAPDKFRDIFDAQDKSIEDRIKAVAQTSLKQILGAQFTEREGKMILDRAYNPAQPKEENIRRMRELVRSLRSQAEAKKASMDYFAENGTLQGFTSPSQAVADSRRQGTVLPRTFQGGVGGQPQFGRQPAPAQQKESDDDFKRRILGE